MGARYHPRWIETLIEENSRAGDVIVFTDGSVVIGKKSGGAYTARVDGKTVSEDSAACNSTMSSWQKSTQWL